MMPVSTLPKKKTNNSTIAAAIKKNAPVKVTEEQSKDIMNSLYSELDNKGVEELQDVN